MNDRWRFITVYIVFAATAAALNVHRDVQLQTNRPLSQFPRQVKSWHMTQQDEFSSQTLEVLKVTDYLSRHYVDGNGKPVHLYIGYHNGGENSGSIHSPKNCLPGSGWHRFSSDQGVLELPNRTLRIVRAVYQKGESRELFLYWFQVRDITLSNEYSLKLAKVFNSVRYGRRDESFVRISLPLEYEPGQSMAHAERFIRDFEPFIQEYLP